MLCTTGSSADRLRSLKTRGERRMDEFLGQVEQQQAGQTAGQCHGNIVAVQRPQMEQLARRWEENDAGKARGRGRDYPPQRRVWPCERGKYRSAKRTIDEDRARSRDGERWRQPVRLSGTESSQTLWWRGVDSNLRFRAKNGRLGYHRPGADGAQRQGPLSGAGRRHSQRRPSDLPSPITPVVTRATHR